MPYNLHCTTPCLMAMTTGFRISMNHHARSGDGQARNLPAMHQAPQASPQGALVLHQVHRVFNTLASFKRLRRMPGSWLSAQLSNLHRHLQLNGRFTPDMPFPNRLANNMEAAETAVHKKGGWLGSAASTRTVPVLKQ